MKTTNTRLLLLLRCECWGERRGCVCSPHTFTTQQAGQQHRMCVYMCCERGPHRVVAPCCEVVVVAGGWWWGGVGHVCVPTTPIAPQQQLLIVVMHAVMVVVGMMMVVLRGEKEKWSVVVEL